MRLQCLLARGYSLNRGNNENVQREEGLTRIPASLCRKNGSGLAGVDFSGYFVSLFSENGGHYPERIFQILYAILKSYQMIDTLLEWGRDTGIRHITYILTRDIP